MNIAADWMVSSVSQHEGHLHNVLAFEECRIDFVSTFVQVWQIIQKTLSSILWHFEHWVTLNAAVYNVSVWCVPQHQKHSEESLLHPAVLFCRQAEIMSTHPGGGTLGGHADCRKSHTVDALWRRKEHERLREKKKWTKGRLQEKKKILLLTGSINKYHDLFPSNESASLPPSNLPPADSLPPHHVSPRE